MKHWISCSILGLSAALLSACSSMPPFDTPVDENNRPTVTTIIDKISCEIAEAKDEAAGETPMRGFKPFASWIAAASLTLTVDDTTGTATAGLPLSFIDILSKTSTYAFGLSPTLYQNRSRTYSQSYTIDISKLPTHDVCYDSLKGETNFNLEGNLGLTDQIRMGLHAFSKSHVSANYYAQATTTTPIPPLAPNGEPFAKTADTFSLTVYFKVYFGVNNVGPTWTLTPFKGPTAGVGYVRDDLHQVVITFAPSQMVAKATPTIKPVGNAPPKPKTKGVEDAQENVAAAKKTLEDAQKNRVILQQESEHAEDASKVVKREKFENAQAEEANAQNSLSIAQEQLASELKLFAQQTLVYDAAARIYEADVQRHNADVAAAAQSAATVNAADTARAANTTAVTNAAINQLSQTLNRP